MMRDDWELTPEKYLNPHELASLLNRADELFVIGTSKKRKALVRDWMLINLAVFSGLRRKEMCDLRVVDLRLGNGQSNIVVRCGKGGKSRVVHIGKELKGTLRRYIQWKAEVGELAPDAYLLRTERSPKYCVAGLWYRWRKYSNKRLHSARHAFGTYAYQACKDLRLVQKQMGHSKPSTTAIYSDVTPETIIAGMNGMERLTRSFRRTGKSLPEILVSTEPA
jgi:integrase